MNFTLSHGSEGVEGAREVVAGMVEGGRERGERAGGGEGGREREGEGVRGEGTIHEKSHKGIRIPNNSLSINPSHHYILRHILTSYAIRHTHPQHTPHTHTHTYTPHSPRYTSSHMYTLSQTHTTQSGGKKMFLNSECDEI